MPERVEQAGKQTGPQHVHVAAERIAKWNHFFANHQFCRGIRNECLALCFEQSERDQNPPRCGELVMHGVIGIRTDSAAGNRRGNLFNTMQPRNLLDEIYLPFEIDSKAWNPEGHRLQTQLICSKWLRLASDNFQPELAKMRLHLC